MCFDRSLIFRLLVMSIAALESLMIAFGISFLTNSFNPRCIHKWCFIAIERAIYSASQVEDATDRCFREHQETVELPSCTRYPEKLRLESRSFA